MNAAQLADLLRRLDEEAGYHRRQSKTYPASSIGRLTHSSTDKLLREAAAELRALGGGVMNSNNGEADAVYWKEMHRALLASFERRSALLREALPFISTFPDLLQEGGDELAERIEAEIMETNHPQAVAPEGR